MIENPFVIFLVALAGLVGLVALAGLIGLVSLMGLVAFGFCDSGGSFGSVGCRSA